jgi:hypothetical protein
MKVLLPLLMVLLAAPSWPAGLDLRKIQSPILDAQSSAKSVRPKFSAFVSDNTSKPRMPGVSVEQRLIISNEYGVKVLNEYRLYDPYEQKLSNQDIQEKLALERYCSRYNRHLLKLLGI